MKPNTKTTITVSGQPPIPIDNPVDFDTAVERTLAAGYTPIETHTPEVWQGYQYIGKQQFLITHRKGGKK